MKRLACSLAISVSSMILAPGALAVVADCASETSCLLQETFDGVDLSSGTRGVPTKSLSTQGFLSGADNDWYGGRFEISDDGSIWQDVGALSNGNDGLDLNNSNVIGNSSQVGIVEDDAGILINIDTRLFTDIQVKFDWRTKNADPPKDQEGKVADTFVVGYFVGDLDGIAEMLNPDIFDETARTFDLRNTENGGLVDGDVNWSPILDQQGAPWGFQGGLWKELFRDRNNDTWTEQQITPLGIDANNQEEVWLAFWLDNGEGDKALVDNIWVGGTVIPVPAAVWFMGSALLGMLGFARRKSAPT